MMIKNKRWLYLALILLTIPAGLFSRSKEHTLPQFFALYGGDVLAATCIFFGVRFIAIQASLWKVLWISYLICIIIETLQLYQAGWIVTIRNTRLGGILLGHGFLWSDWVCYAAGVSVAFLISLGAERLLKKK